MGRPCFVVLLGALLSVAVLAQPTQPVGNADIVKMVKAGLGERVVISAIERAPNANFDVSIDDLIALKQAGVPNAVIEAMQHKGAPTTTPVVPRPEPSPPLAGGESSVDRLPSGIYVEVLKQGTATKIPMEPTVISRTRTRGGLGSAFTMGIAKTDWVAEVRGAKAALRITDPRPTFYFYFSDRVSVGSTGPFVGWLAAATSPNEFVLIEMYRERDRRELVVGKSGLTGSSMGVESENTVPLSIERLVPGVYRVKPEGPFEQSGEFSFFYAAGAGTLVGTGVVGKLFDFGIDLGK